MELVGLKVKHSVLGIGVITENDEKSISVKFDTKTSKFIFPDAFEKFFKVVDPNDLQMIIDAITEAHAVAEQKRQAKTAAAEQRRAAEAAARRNQEIDEMFGADYHAEHLDRQTILTYQDVESQFGIHRAGFGRGINVKDDEIILISAISQAGTKFVYHDKWTVDADYIYSGEGMVGDQMLTGGNLAIANAARDGKKIHLFIKLSSQEYYYQGVFELVEYTYEDDKDEDGNIRKEYKFRLKKTVSACQHIK